MANNSRYFGYQLSASIIKYAIDNCRTAQECARFLNVSYNTYKYYAKQYVDEESGLTYFQLSKSKDRIKTGSKLVTTETNIQRITEGLVENFCTEQKFKESLIYYGHLSENCAVCGYSERRILDYQMPLVLDWIDGNRRNGHRDNVRLLCYNCYFQLVGNVKIVRTNMTYDISEYGDDGDN